MRKRCRESLKGSDLSAHLKGSMSLIRAAVHICILDPLELKCISEGLLTRDQEGERHERTCRIQTACLSGCQVKIKNLFKRGLDGAIIHIHEKSSICILPMRENMINPFPSASCGER